MRQTSTKDTVCFWLQSGLIAIAFTLFASGFAFSQGYRDQPPQVDPETLWLNDSVKRDPDVQSASHEVGLPNNAERLADSSNNMFAEIRDDAVDEFSGVEDSYQQVGSWGERLKQKFAGADVQKMIGSLAIVLGGYFGFVWVWRRFSPGGSGGLPSEVLQVVGQTTFGPKKTLQLVRLGTKLLLLINGPEGTHPIGEITDPTEVEHITSLCSGRGTRGQSDKRTVFNNLVRQLQDKAPAAAPTPVVAPIVQPQVIATPLVQQPAAPSSSSNGELEQILRTLTQVVSQSKHHNEFEA